MRDNSTHTRAQAIHFLSRTLACVLLVRAMSVASNPSERTVMTDQQVIISLLETLLSEQRLTKEVLVKLQSSMTSLVGTGVSPPEPDTNSTELSEKQVRFDDIRMVHHDDTGMGQPTTRMLDYLLPPTLGEEWPSDLEGRDCWAPASSFRRSSFAEDDVLYDARQKLQSTTSESSPQLHRIVMHAHSLPIFVGELLSYAFLLCDCVAVPYSLAWNLSLPAWYITITTVFWALDMVRKFSHSRPVNERQGDVCQVAGCRLDVPSWIVCFGRCASGN